MPLTEPQVKKLIPCSFSVGTSGRKELRVAPGLAVDRLGRLVELGVPVCLRLERWFATELAGDGGDDLRRRGYHLESLAIVQSMNPETGEIEFRR